MEGNYKGRVLFILNPGHGNATAKIRGTIYEELLKREGWIIAFASISSDKNNPEFDKYKRSDQEIIEMAKNYDLIYLLKVNKYFLIKKIQKSTNAKIVFDLTDALWRRGFRKAWIFLEEILQLSDAIFSENEYVCEYARRFNDNVFSLAACTQTEKFEKHKQVSNKNKNNKVVIGWIGSEPTITAIYSIIKPLERLFSKHPNLELRILGCADNGIKTRLRNIRYSLVGKYSEDEMIHEAHSMDIGIFPPPGDMEDYRIRGALKGMIYMSAAIPAVCFNSGDAAKMIKDGVTGMLVNNEAEWETKIEKLVLDPNLRESMGSKAFEFIKREHSLEKVGQSLSMAFSEVLKLKRIKKKNKISSLKKIKILINTILLK
ncbi:MAG: glycosyltransferase [Cytophagales bacterium]|nr:glycosyltransferase [Cytophagales bacterium]